MSEDLQSFIKNKMRTIDEEIEKVKRDSKKLKEELLSTIN